MSYGTSESVALWDNANARNFTDTDLSPEEYMSVGYKNLSRMLDRLQGEYMSLAERGEDISEAVRFGAMCQLSESEVLVRIMQIS